MKTWGILFLAVLFFFSNVCSCVPAKAAEPFWEPAPAKKVKKVKKADKKVVEPAAEQVWQPSPLSEVQNTVAKQVGNRAVFTYDLTGNEADAEVDVVFIIQGKTYKATDLHLEGDFGKTGTGKGKTIYWNALQDFPRGFSDYITWDISVRSNKDVAVKAEKAPVAKKAKKLKKADRKVAEPADEPIAK
jgi:hypothetical protein